MSDLYDKYGNSFREHAKRMGAPPCFPQIKKTNMTFTTERPKEDGFYYVIWEENDEPVLLWINYFPKGTLFKNDFGDWDDDYWTWAYFQSDDPQSLELDVRYPEKIQFAKA